MNESNFNGYSFYPFDMFAVYAVFDIRLVGVGVVIFDK